MSGKGIFAWVRLLAPMILANIPATKQIAGKVSAGLDEAEAIHDASGTDKLAHVVALGRNAAEAINAEKPGSIDPNTVESAITEGVNTAFSVAKIVHDAHGAPEGVVAVPPAAEVAPVQVAPTANVVETPGSSN